MSRVAFFSTLENVSWGGSEELWARAALHLHQLGHDVFASVGGSIPVADEVQRLSIAGISVYLRNSKVIASHTGFITRLNQALRKTAPVQTSQQSEANDWSHVNAWLQTVKPDFVLISQSFLTDGYTIREACRHSHVPYAVLVQSADDHVWLSADLSKAVAAQFEEAIACFCVSDNMLKFMRRCLATPLDKAEIVYNPMHDSVKGPILPFLTPMEPFKLACVARLQCSQKGQDLLMELLAGQKWRDRPVSISLFGSGPDEAHLRRLHNIFGSPNVELCGRVQDIQRVWKEHHALILPSRYEGMPLAVLEAMRCGRPCIVTDVMGSAELIEDGINGFVASAPTVKMLDIALERAWQARDEWPSIGQRAFDTINARVPEDAGAEFALRIATCIQESDTNVTR